MGSAKGSLWIVPVGLAALAFAVRAVGLESALSDGQAVPSVGDGWYHLRRIVYDAARLPSLLGFDPFVQFPQGASAPWPPLFDALIAWGTLPFAGGIGQGVVGAALWAPPVIGSLTVACLYGLLRPRVGVAAALAAAALLALLPAHVEATRIGALSQRCAGGLVAVLALAATLRLVESDLRSRRAAVATGLALGFGVLLSTGGVLVAAAVQLALMLLVAFRSSLWNRDAIGCVVAVQVLALVVLLPAAALRAGPEAGLFTAAYPSRTHLALVAVPCATALAWLMVWRVSPRALRGLLVLGLAVLAAVVGWVVAPPVIEGGRGAWEVVFGPVSLNAARVEPAFAIGSLLGELTLFGWVAPLALPFLAWAALGRDAPMLVLLGASALFLAVSFAVPGGHALGAVAVALVAGIAFAGAARFLAPRIPGKTGVAVVASVFVLLASPALLRAGTAEARRGIDVSGIEVPLARVLAVSEWLRTNTPPSTGWLDVETRPPYGVLAPWALGDVFSFRSWRPTVVDSLSSPNRVERSDAFFASSPGIAAKIAKDWEVRYVVMPVGLHETADVPSPMAIARALLEFDGSETEELRPGEPPRVVRFRLVYEVGEPSDPAALRVYERVSGARLGGVTKPGGTVVASIRLRTNSGREFTWRSSTRADGVNGYYEFYLPYSTEGGTFRRDVEAQSAWVISCGTESGTRTVIDWKVRKTGFVRGPGLCRP